MSVPANFDMNGATKRHCPYCAEPIQFYAIVCRWCGRSLVSPTATSADIGRHAVPALVAVAGGLLAVATALPWLHVILLGNTNLFQLVDLARAGRISSPLLLFVPVTLIVSGILAILAAITLDGSARRVAALVIFLTSGLLCGLLLAGLFDVTISADGLAALGAGPWAVLIGDLLLLAAAIIPNHSPRRMSVQASSAATSVGSLVVLCLTAVSVVALTTGPSVVPADSTVSPSAPSYTASEPTQPAPLPYQPAISTESTPQPPGPSTAFGLPDAEAVVESLGYTPNPNTTWYQPTGLNVIVATAADSADGYAQKAFFFYDNRYLGTDSTADSAGIQVLWSDDTTVALSYALYQSGDPNCCPSQGSATVRYHWTGTGLVPLDPIPSADVSVTGSRR